jgi:hypothetical protein
MIFIYVLAFFLIGLPMLSCAAKGLFLFIDNEDAKYSWGLLLIAGISCLFIGPVWTLALATPLFCLYQLDKSIKG